MKDPSGPFPYLLRYEIRLLSPYPGPEKDPDGKIHDNTIWNLGHSTNLLKIDGRRLFGKTSPRSDSTILHFSFYIFRFPVILSAAKNPFFPFAF